MKYLLVKGQRYPAPMFDDLDLGELHILESMAGLNGMDLARAAGDGNFAIAAGLVVIAKRRAGERFNVEDAWKLKPSDLDRDGDGEDAENVEVDPQAAGAAEGAQPATS